MIPIKINNKKYKIKPINDLTTREFIELINIEELDYTKYIAWQTGLKMDEAFFSVVSYTIEKAIGNVPDVGKLPRPKQFDYSRKIETIGQRYQVEESNAKGYDLIVFVLAVAQARSNNIDDVYKLRDKYMDQNFKEVLPAAIFFFNNLKNGKNSGTNFLKKLINSIRIKS